MGFFLTIFYLVMIYLRPQEWVEEIRGLPLVDFVVVLCLAGVFLEGSFSAAKFKRSPVTYWVFFLWFALVASHVANFNLYGALHAFRDFGSQVVLAYLLIIFTVDSFRRIRILLWVVLIMSLFLSGQAIYQYYTGEGLVGGEALQRSTGEGDVILQARGIGIFADPNDLALSVVTWLPFLMPAFHRPFLSPTILSGVIMMLPMITGVVFTRSRGGLLGLAFVFWFYFYRRVGMVLSFGFLVVVISLIMAVPRMGTLDTTEASTRGRMTHWVHGMELFKANPVFGIGMDRFTDTHDHTAHNSFMLVLSEAGFLGALAWVGIFVAAIRELIFMKRLGRAPPWLHPLVDGLLGAILAWQVCAFFLSQTYKFLGFVVVALVVCIMNAMAREGIELRHPWAMAASGLALAATIGMVAFMHLLLRFLWGYL